MGTCCLGVRVLGLTAGVRQGRQPHQGVLATEARAVGGCLGQACSCTECVEGSWSTCVTNLHVPHQRRQTYGTSQQHTIKPTMLCFGAGGALLRVCQLASHNCTAHYSAVQDIVHCCQRHQPYRRRAASLLLSLLADCAEAARVALHGQQVITQRLLAPVIIPTSSLAPTSRQPASGPACFGCQVAVRVDDSLGSSRLGLAGVRASA